MMTVTQKQIAERLNVSIMTVSKALNNHPDVSERTRELVQKTAREMNYHVNVIARSLVRKKTQTIGVIVTDISELFYAEVLNGIESVTRARGYQLLLASADNDPAIEIQSLQTLIENRVDGLLFSPTEKNDDYLDLLNSLQIPYVLFNNTHKNLNCDSIRVDRGRGAFESLNYLIQKGYEELYFFYTFSQMAESRHSLEGCLNAVRQSGLSENQFHPVQIAEHQLDLFYNKAKELIRPGQRRSGILAWDDETAIGIYRALSEKGIEIPEQAGLIGFDDIKIASFLPKALTTVFYPKFKMGRLGAELLLNRIEKKVQEEKQNIVLNLELKLRETA